MINISPRQLDVFVQIALHGSVRAAAERLGVAVDAAGHAAIVAVLARRERPPGDTFTLERDRVGRHGRIMKYGLNRR